jgi:hypothetical protein
MAALLLTQPVYLNHFYVTVDPATYESIVTSEFLKTQFAPFEERRTARNDRTYTGAYFYGRNTYFEFFKTGQDSRRPGDSGLAFGVEEPGGLNTLLGDVERAPRTREIEGRQIPWFTELTFRGLAGHTTRLRSFVMEYDPEFLREWRPGASPSDGTIRRSNILRRYRAVLAQKPQAPLLEDVTAITVAVDRHEADLIARELSAFGYTAAADNTVFTGPGITLHLMAASATQCGIQRVSLRTNGRGSGPSDHSFGPRSKLSFTSDHTAEWTF